MNIKDWNIENLSVIHCESGSKESQFLYCNKIWVLHQMSPYTPDHTHSSLNPTNLTRFGVSVLCLGGEHPARYDQTCSCMRFPSYNMFFLHLGLICKLWIRWIPSKVQKKKSKSESTLTSFNWKVVSSGYISVKNSVVLLRFLMKIINERGPRTEPLYHQCRETDE